MARAVRPRGGGEAGNKYVLQKKVRIMPRGNQRPVNASKLKSWLLLHALLNAIIEVL